MPDAIAFPRTEVASKISKARLEAEAAFGPIPQGPRDKPIVVVKRKRSRGVSTEGHAQSRSMPDSVDENRTPRVYRVEAVLVAGDETPGASEAEPRDVPAASPGDDASNTAVKSPKRQRRRSVHGEVTIIRPEPTKPSTPESTDPPIATRAGESSVLRSLCADPDVVARYDAVMAQIEALKHEAVQLKKTESASAVRWIKRAIADYGLTAQDLGLRAS